MHRTANGTENSTANRTGNRARNRTGDTETEVLRGFLDVPVPRPQAGKKPAPSLRQTLAKVKSFPASMRTPNAPVNPSIHSWKSGCFGR